MKKTLANAIAVCYPTLKDSISGNHFDVDSLYSKDDPLNDLWTNDSKGDRIYLPTKVGNTINDTMISCKEVFNGFHKKKQDVDGLFSIYGKSNPSLTDLGYTKDERPAGYKGCMTLSYKKAGAGGMDVSVTSNTFCIPVNADGTITVGVLPDITSTPDGFDGIFLNSTWNGCGLFQSGVCQLWVDVRQGIGLSYSVEIYNKSGSKTFNAIVDELSGILDTNFNYEGSSYTGVRVTGELEPDDLFVEYTRSDVNAMIKYFTGSKTAPKFTDDDINFLLETYYQRFKSDGYISEDNGKCDQVKGNVQTSTEYPYMHYDTSKGWCPVRIANSDAQWMNFNIIAGNRTELVPATVSEILEIITNGKFGYKNMDEYCDKVVFSQRVDEIWDAWQAAKKEVDPTDTAKLKELEEYYLGLATKIGDLRREGKFTETDASGDIVCAALPTVDGGTDQTKPDTSVDNTPSIDPGESDPGGGSKPTCFSDGSALGWILCPALEIMSNAVNGMYDTVANEWLEIGASEMGATDSNGVYVGWKSFRDMANIIFVIMLIIVIFSQVTGLGLTNYGIKKTLPTLIMVAVLVNLSFIICQLAVDVTNILGDGLRKMFENLEVVTGTGVGLSDIVTGISSGLLQLTVVGGAAALAIHFSGASLAMLLVPLLLALISALIGTIIFFLSLAIRKAGIFAMVILCPVAIICYALPNTKKFFDRWLKLFTALLTIYPICGILMGGGKFFSSVLLTSGSNGFFMALTAMLIQVIPFFFIPTLVRGSLNMISGLGAKLAGFQSRLARGAQGMLGRSHWAQDRQQRLNRDANIRRDARLASKWQKRLQTLDTKRNADGELNKKNQKRYRRAEYELGRARSRSDRAMIEDMQNSVMSGREALAPGTMRYDNVMDKLKNAANDEEVEELRNSLLNKHMSYSDGGNDYDVDANVVGAVNADGTLDTSKANARNSLSAALLHYMHQYDANPSDKSALARIRALTKQMLDAGGDAGQTAVANTLRGYTSAAGGNSTRTQSFNDLTDYISRNGKWMAKFKPTDRGAFNLIGDGASSTAVLRTSSEYNIAGGYAPDMVPDLSDGAFDALDLEIANAHRTGIMSQDVKNSIANLNSTLEQAYGDPRIAGRIKPNVTARANAIHEEAYKIERQSWLSSNNNVQKLQGKDRSGNVVNAAGTKIINGEKYLVDARNQVLKSLYGAGKATANEAYRRQIKGYQELRTDNGPADMNIPH